MDANIPIIVFNTTIYVFNVMNNNNDVNISGTLIQIAANS